MKKNIIANIVGKFWSILSGFLFIPLYIKLLGFESYSIISFTLIIAGIMSVLDSGLTSTLSREFARSDNSLLEKRKTFNTLETVYIIIIIIITTLIFLFASPIANNWLNLKDTKPEQVVTFIKIIGFEIGFQMLFRFYMGGLLGFEQQVKANIFQIGWGIFRNGLVLIIIYFSPLLKMFFLWQLFSTILFTIIIRVFLKRILDDKYTFSFKPILEKVVFHRIWRFAGGMLLISLVASLNTQMDKLMISNLLDIETLGYYTLALSMAVGIHILISPISVALLPRFTAMYSNGDKQEAVVLFKKINLLIAIIVFSFMGNMIFFAKELIFIWTGNLVLAEKASIYLTPLSISYVMLALATIPYDIAIANGYTKLNNILGIISLIITMPGYWLATRHFGAIGAAYVYSFVQTTITIIYIYLINKKFIQSSIFDLMFKRLFFPIIIAISASYMFSLIPNLFSNSRVLTLVWIGIFTLATIALSLFVLVPIKELRNVSKIK